MRNVVSILIVTVCICAKAQMNPTKENSLQDTDFTIEKVIGDAKPALVYVYNKNSNWCKVTPNGDQYMVIRSSKAPNIIVCDTLLVNSPILSWGLNDFYKIYKNQQNSANDRNSSRLIALRTPYDNIVRIADIDLNNYDAATQAKINDLYYTLHWFASPTEVRESIARPDNLTILAPKKPGKIYEHKDRGFYIATDLSVSYSFGHGFHPATKDHNMGFFEIDVAGGWMFSEYTKLGLGIGGRYYFAGKHIINHHFGLPLYIDFRGNLLSYKTNKLVPFYILNVGCTFPDGIMIRPQIGLKFGQPHQFTVAFGYVGQAMRRYNYLFNNAGFEMSVNDGYKRKYFSYLTLKLGYEF